MAQPSQIVPTVTTNISGTKQQVNLRDYLNVRVAPFLKKAIHDSLETEAQYPLQWLGEHLIQQSIIYEGNPDATNLRERFVYNHDMALPKPPTTTEPESEHVPQAPQPSVSHAPNVVNGIGAASMHAVQEGDPNTLPDATNEAEGTSQTPAPDTEMGGTS